MCEVCLCHCTILMENVLITWQNLFGNTQVKFQGTLNSNFSCNDTNLLNIFAVIISMEQYSPEASLYTICISWLVTSPHEGFNCFSLFLLLVPVWSFLVFDLLIWGCENGRWIPRYFGKTSNDWNILRQSLRLKFEFINLPGNCSCILLTTCIGCICQRSFCGLQDWRRFTLRKCD